jgi:hypothetical protein
MGNTKYKNATGGTSIIEWLSNQIGAVLTYMTELLFHIDDEKFFVEYVGDLRKKKSILEKQQVELRKENFDLEKVFESNTEFNDKVNIMSCSFSKNY